MDYDEARESMVREQLEGRDIHDERVLAAFRKVPRHEFVPEDLRDLAYRDGPLPIDANQTISQPYIVAYMTQLLELAGTETVLEVGTGSGYQTAILARLAARVYSLERHRSLAEPAAERLNRLGFTNVEVLMGDGSQGLPDQAPFDAILVTAAAPEAPAPLLSQLAVGGRLVIPVGLPRDQILERWQRRGGTWHIEHLAPVAFVPLVGKFGFPENDEIL